VHNSAMTGSERRQRATAGMIAVTKLFNSNCVLCASILLPARFCKISNSNYNNHSSFQLFGLFNLFVFLSHESEIGENFSKEVT
jgi:hypothetical protein